MDPFVSNAWQDQSLSPSTYLQTVRCLVEGLIVVFIVHTWGEIISPAHRRIVLVLITLLLPSRFRLPNRIQMTMALLATWLLNEASCFLVPVIGYAMYLCIANLQMTVRDFQENSLAETCIEWRSSNQTVLKLKTFAFTCLFLLQGPRLIISFLRERPLEAFLVLVVLALLEILVRLHHFKWSYIQDLLEATKFWTQDCCRRYQRRPFELTEKWRIGLTSLKKYKYTPLKDGQIRIFCISRRSGHSFLLRGTILHADLDNLPPYEAISYTWGDITQSKIMLVDGCQLAVSAGLYGLLEAMSSPDKDVLLWVDFICIDQADDDDTAKQIPIMRDIYRRAFRTVVWLGAPYDAPLAVSMLFEVLDIVKSPDYQPIAMYDRYFPQMQSPRWIALVKLLHHCYFSRVWILQEVAVSRGLVFYFGGRYITWETFMLAKTALQHPHTASLVTALGVHHRLGDVGSARNANIMAFFRLLTAKGIDIPLGFALSFSQRFRCKMPEDRVIALLGLCSSEEFKSTILQDIGKSPLEIYLTTSKLLLTSPENSVHLFQYSGIGNHNHDESLPTWCVDWGAELGNSTFTIPFLHEVKDIEHGPITTRRYSAAGKSKPHIVEGHLPLTLQIGGAKIDVIKRLTHIMLAPFLQTSSTVTENREVEIARTSIRFYSEAFRLAKETLPAQCQNGQPILNTIWRTLIANRSADEHPAPQIYAQHFQKWLESMIMILQESLTGPLSMLADAQQMSNYKYEALLGGTLSFQEQFVEACALRRFCVTEEGWMGLVPMGAKVGDEVCLVWGMQTPYVLRAERGKGVDRAGLVYEVIGECYMHGMMAGEMADVAKGVSFTVI